jgi:hypothetical protein
MKNITIEDWRRFFPFQKVRSEQERAINFALNSFINEGKKYVILELGTGVGKSATGITVARYLEANIPPEKDETGEPITGAYVVTTQKILQEQYLRDFGPSCGGLVRSIKSSNNYTCSFYTDQSCAESKRLLMKLAKQLSGTDFQKNCKTNCQYSLEKQDFINSSIAVTNFPYILAESMYAGQLSQRATLIVDEAHNTEGELGKFIEIIFSEKFTKDVLKCKLPKTESQSAVYEWITSTYVKSLKKHIKSLEKSLAKLSGDIEGYGALSKQYEILDKHICKINRFLEVYRPENWVMNVTMPAQDNKRAGKKYEFKPIDVSPFAYSTFFRLGTRALMMSATIVDKTTFCESLGISSDEASYLSIPSPFPVENRPIHCLPVGAMSKNSIDSTLPKLVEVINMILENHKGEKGIIHAVNYKIARYIQENLKSDRIMIHDASNRDEMLKKHITTLEPTVLLSPSMMEGVDLHDDLSRFQVICKVPFPFLGDLVSVKRKELRKSWYEMQTVKLILQSVGRSIRNENDHASTYILDDCFLGLYSKNKWMFPVDFQKSIK